MLANGCKVGVKCKKNIQIIMLCYDIGGDIFNIFQDSTPSTEYMVSTTEEDTV